MRLILLGAPGAGKGTSALALSSILKVPHISSGDIFRDNIQQKTELGILANGYISKGSLVPDEITVRMMDERLTKPDCDGGFILDGYPRTLGQAKALDEFLDSIDESIDHVISIVVSEEELVKRLTSRRVCSKCGGNFSLRITPDLGEQCPRCGAELIQRSDDREDVIKRRFVAYYRETEPLIEYYRERGRLSQIRSEHTAEDTVENILYALRLKGPKQKTGETGES